MSHKFRKRISKILLGLLPNIFIEEFFAYSQKILYTTPYVHGPRERLLIAEDAKMQVSLVNWSESVKFQVGLLNGAKDDGGFQAGFIGNYAGTADIQIGLANMATSESRQLSLFGNYAGKTNFQMGLLNITETLEGNQFGFINIAKYSTGCQIGFINLTSKKESGFPLLPFVNCSM